MKRKSNPEGHETCTSLAKALGKPYTPSNIGKIKKLVCEDEDMDENLILPSGVLKITAHIEHDMEMIETASPDIVTLQVLHHQTANPQYIMAMDLETKRKIHVLVPRNRKAILNVKGRRFKAERGSEKGSYVYRYAR
jgi:hypothetical protein